MYIISDLFDYPIAQSYHGKTSDDACQYIADETSRIPVLEHLHALVCKGGEGGETSANARSEEEVPRTGRGAILAEKGEQKTENEASQKVDGQCSPREALSAYVLHHR